MQISILNQQNKIPINKKAIEQTVIKIFGLLKRNFSRDSQITIVYTDNRFIQKLNYEFLGRDEPTDVLSFDLSENKNFVANIVISTDKACQNARIFKTSPLYESRLYLIHGILHLLGYRDHRKKDRIRMQRKAIQILKNLN